MAALETAPATIAPEYNTPLSPGSQLSDFHLFPYGTLHRLIMHIVSNCDCNRLILWGARLVGPSDGQKVLSIAAHATHNTEKPALRNATIEVYAMSDGYVLSLLEHG